MAFGIPFAAVQDMVRHIFEVAPADYDKLLARLRNMQREGFPPGVNVGRGLKVGYSLEQVSAVMFLHMLVDAGFPPVFAIRLFHDHRTEILSVVGDGCRDFSSGSEPVPPGPATMYLELTGAVLAPRRLAGTAGGSDLDGAAPALLRRTMAIEVQRNLIERLASPSGLHLYDFGHLMRRGIIFLLDEDYTTEDDIIEALESLPSPQRRD